VGPSLLVAALFAVHPLNVESVAWVAERKNVLSTLFFILAIAAYAWYAQKPDWRRYLLVAALFAAGLMAKPMVITLPFCLDAAGLLAAWQNGGQSGFRRRRAAIDRIEAGAGENSVACSLGRQRMDHAHRAANGSCSAYLRSVSARHAHRECPRGLWAISLQNALARAACSLSPFPHAPGMAVDFVGAGFDKYHGSRCYFSPQALLAGGWFWVSGDVVPVLGLVQVGEYAMADRYAYIPLIGVFVMIAWGLADWAQAKEVVLHGWYSQQCAG